MTPQDLVSALVTTNEEQGRQLLQSHIPLFSPNALDRLVYYLKKEADRCWNTDAPLSLVLSGHLLLVANLAHNTYYHALGLMARGDALRRLDRNLEALPFFDAAGEEFMANDDEVGWARTRIGRVSACLQLNRTTEALNDAEAAHAIFIRHGKLRRAGQIDVNAAIINFELGQYDQALRLFDRAIETYALHGDGVELNIARARGNKALTLAAQGKFREAVALHEQARATFAMHGEREEISVAREELNVADIYAAQGHYSQALLLYNQSRALFQKHSISLFAAEVAQQMCWCLVCLNRSREAYELAGETVNFFRTSPGPRHNLARSLMHQASAAILMERLSEADSMLREASTLLEEGGFIRLAALARLKRAELYYANKQLDESLSEAEFVADVFAEQEDLPHLAQVMLLQGLIADAKGRTETAYDLCNQALDIAEGQGLLELKYACYDLLGQIAERSGKPDDAASYYDLAIQGIEEVQSRLVMDARASFLENKKDIYQRAIMLALKRNLKDQALIYVEKAKSRVLGDYLRSNIDIRLRAGDQNDEHILEDLEKLREEQAWFSSIVHDTEDEASLSDTAIMRIRSIGPTRARNEMQKRERRIEQLLEQMQLRAVGELVVRPHSNWTNTIVTSLWPNLEPTALMIEYYLADQDVYIFYLTRAGIDVEVLNGAVPKLERLLSLWRTNLELAAQAANSPDPEQAFLGLQQNSLGLLQRLYDLLLRPLGAVLANCEQILIVPYGLLHYLPFHCLFDGTHFVVERFQISYLPSASLMDICHQRGQSILSRGVQLEKSLVMGLSDGGRLSYAVQEANVVASQLHVSSALDVAATTTLLRRLGATSPIVHIAAHGLFRLDAPNFSYIKLADRQLSTIEAFNLNLAECSLVVLSACETGRAVVGGGDEVIGLGRGFLYAGAASLLPTLWKVDDASSAELMGMFYQALLSGYTKAAALSSAQRAFVTYVQTSEQSYRAHPYFWAAFHLIGDSGPLLHSAVSNAS